jgi:hypothetical protein
MRWRSLFAVVVLVLMPVAMLMATPRVVLMKPPPGQYNIEQLWNVTVYNAEGRTDTVWLEGTITEAAKGQVFWAKTNRFQLPPKTKVMRYVDILRIGIAQDSYAPGYKEFAIRSGGLPPGDYTFTVWLMPDFGSSPVEFTVRPMGPPRLIQPRDGDTVKVKYPQFVWTPPMPRPSGALSYELKLAEVLTSQTPEEALRANPPWFEQKDIRATSLTYSASARALPDTGSYAWQVTARDPSGVLVTSQPRVFTVLKSGVPQAKYNLTMDAIIVWQHQNPVGPNWEIWYADFSSGANRVFTPQPLYTTPGNNMDPAVAYDRGGNTWVVWSHYDVGLSQYRIFWSRRKSGQTTWSAPDAVTLPTGSHQMDPAVAFDDNGRGFCVWVEGNITATNDLTGLQASFWDGSNWLTPASKGPGVTGTGRLPEITFTGAPAYGPGNPQTSHAAVVIAALQDPPGKMGWWAWNGSGWSGCNVLPTTGGVVTHSYTGYLNPAPTPAQDRVTIASIPGWFGNLGYPVTAAWTRQSATTYTKLMACNGYCSGSSWTWYEYPSFLGGTAGTTYHDPAVAVDGVPGNSRYVFIGPGTVYEKASSYPKLLTPPPGGSSGSRPAIAWVSGPRHGALAAWYGPTDSDVHWSFQNDVGLNWTQPVALVLPGLDLNPDVAAKSGSHTMPVK